MHGAATLTCLRPMFSCNTGRASRRKQGRAVGPGTGVGGTARTGRASPNVSRSEGRRTMNRRVVLGGLAAALLGLLGGPGLTARAEDKPAAHKDHLHGQAAKCARACADCMLACESCAHHCAHLVAEGKKDPLRAVGTCADCGELCAAAAKVVARHG